MSAMRVINMGPDPSLAYRPNLKTNETKEKEGYRNFENSVWTGCSHTKLGMMDAIMSLDQLVDESDPDVDFPNSFHAFQTAEGIRQAHPDNDWFQLVGLIHDVGKTMALWDVPQWAVVGDTFPVGCQYQNSIVFRDNSFMDNPDEKNSRYNTEFGIYEPNCGLDKVHMSWGHDEYLYRVLKFNNCCIPEEGLYMIRFHSFYPWHSHGDYMHLCNEKDLRMLPWVQEFNGIFYPLHSKFDLYTKTTELPDVDKLKPYYQSLIDKYCPGILKCPWSRQRVALQAMRVQMSMGAGTPLT
ncbi:hypothetical protein F7725_022809 [Dissostichus mawsoni]|uniref:Inositol oxygenase n=1 Tax=Dissostichus mawsoni TaxID=36200 RepID=A0A7J5YYV7_DISMA|nr:hypothetical protein F7725_022809 [Dissostichus mawsoni]